MPDGGIGYGLLRHLNPETGARLAGLAPAPVLFNYLGREAPSTAAWGPAPETEAVRGEGADLPLSHLLEINAVVRDDVDGPQLVAEWTWPARVLSVADVRSSRRTGSAHCVS